MLNIELFAKQLNGLDVQSLINKPKYKPDEVVPNLEMDYYVYRGKKGYASFLSSMSKQRKISCNIKLIFDGRTNLLKDVKFIEIKHKDNQKWKK